MTEKGRIALYKGLGQPFEIREYPVPEPEPGAILIKISMANICGSDLHWWRGELDPAMLVFTSKSIIAVITYGHDTLKNALDFLSRTKGKYPFDKILSHSYPLEEIDKAFEEQDKGFVSRSAIVM